MSAVPTIRIKSEGGFLTINASDFDAKKHVKWQDSEKAPDGGPSAEAQAPAATSSGESGPAAGDQPSPNPGATATDPPSEKPSKRKGKR